MDKKKQCIRSSLGLRIRFIVATFVSLFLCLFAHVLATDSHVNPVRDSEIGVAAIAQLRMHAHMYRSGPINKCGLQILLAPSFISVLFFPNTAPAK